MPQQPEHLRNISIHAPREGCDDESVYVICESVFQSTHPVRGASLTATVSPSGVLFQSTHPVRGASARGLGKTYGMNFNPRTP
ncbi:hypothetical protein B5784_0503 [Bifidobacterium bifidum]|nr:hypothetical protein B5784_0503 [Bifidobacterium bifidum]